MILVLSVYLTIQLNQCFLYSSSTSPKERVSVLAHKVGRCLLKDLLKNRKMTQQELANQLGITVQQVNKYVLNKQKMSYETAFKIAEVLNCKMEELYEQIEAGGNE